MATPQGLILATAAGASLALVLLPSTLRALARKGLVRENFRGEPIPVGYGVALALTGAVFAAFTGGGVLAAGLFGFSALGLVDDLFGDRSAGGFGGHLRALADGRVTTGLLKAILGGVFALVLAGVAGGGFGVVVVDALLIALFANAVNLLDLRPGRALKVFLPLGGALALTGQFGLAALFGAGIAAWRVDLRARAMMGDAGSNALGAAIGIGALALPLWVRLVLVVLLMAFHAYTERASLTRAIERSAFLRRLDELGRHT